MRAERVTTVEEPRVRTTASSPAMAGEPYPFLERAVGNVHGWVRDRSGLVAARRASGRGFL